jgi:AAA domain, putative AbiEii toxin, Type IV TA system
MEFTIRVSNFASFVDSEPFTIRDGLNVFLGINNSGKTALLLAIAGLSESAWQNQSFREFMPGYFHKDADPMLTVEFILPADQREKVLRRLCELGGNPDFDPTPSSVPESLRFQWLLIENRAALCGMLFRGGPDSTERNLINWAGVVIEHPQGKQRVYGSSGLPGSRGRTNHATDFFIAQDPVFLTSNLGWPSIFSSPIILSAQRRSPARMQYVHTVELDSIGSNLALVLATAWLTTESLPNGRDLVKRIESYMGHIFPEIKGIRTPSIPSPNTGLPSSVEVVIDLTNGRTVSLDRSGTGVQQMLCLVTGAVLTQKQTLFLIDEPHSFLHPAAERGLLELLENLTAERHHIFVIATHSHIFASHARERIYAVSMIGASSKVRTIDGVQKALDTLGVRNMDLFTYDMILFVEGPSDCDVFQKVLAHFHPNRQLDRMKIVPLGGDGLLKSKTRRQVVKILVRSNATETHVPLILIFDSNDWNASEQQDLRQVCKQSQTAGVHFLALPELENYLLEPTAIAHVINEKLGSDAGVERPTPQQVAVAIPTDVVVKNGSDVMESCFRKWACAYDKNPDSARIAEQILIHQPGFLRPLADELSRRLWAPQTVEPAPESASRD